MQHYMFLTSIQNGLTTGMVQFRTSKDYPMKFMLTSLLFMSSLIV